MLGYVNSAGDGQYGMEGTFNDILKGQDGIFTSQIDANGNQITVGDSVIEGAIDGANITLTIDRAVQLEVEKLLAEGVKNYQADSGQAIVMDPKTGEIIAMAQAPTFDPNVYGEVFEKYVISLSEDQKIIYTLLAKVMKQNIGYTFKKIHKYESNFSVIKMSLMYITLTKISTDRKFIKIKW